MILRNGSFVAAVMLLCMALVSRTEIIVGDLETELNGWTLDGAASISQSTIGATSGSKSLLVQGSCQAHFSGRFKRMTTHWLQRSRPTRF